MDMNLDSQKNFYGSIYLHGLTCREDDAAIADLIAAAQHETQDRVLDLGFRVILVQCQQTNITMRQNSNVLLMIKKIYLCSTFYKFIKGFLFIQITIS